MILNFFRLILAIAAMIVAALSYTRTFGGSLFADLGLMTFVLSAGWAALDWFDRDILGVEP